MFGSCNLLSLSLGQNGSLGSFKDKPAPSSTIESGKVKITAQEIVILGCKILLCGAMSMCHTKASLPPPGPPAHTGTHCPGAHRATAGADPISQS